MHHILIVEDEAVIRGALRRLLERHEYQVTEACSVNEAMQYDFSNFHLIISDLRLPGATGVELIKPAGDTPVLIMTSYASLRSAVDSMRKGAIDYIAKPFEHDDMIKTVRRIISDKAGDKPSSNKTSNINPGGMIGDCDAMQTVYQYIRKVAPTSTSVLIHGETGTGKEKVAQAIHRESRRAEKQMISVNCAAIPDTLIESELFGYEKGAFTGAQTSRIGLIEAADGSTLFLDEIGELPLEAQARLLRFIQEDEIRAIGSVHSKKVDVRLITATHRDLKALTSEGKFREDLYYRINVMQIKVPPLRERGKDILQIAETLLKRTAEKHSKGPLHFSAKAVQAITTYQWPGNIRELENAIERAVILTDIAEIDYELFNIELDLINTNHLRINNRPSFAQHHQYSERKPRSSTPQEDPTEDLSLEDYFQRFVLEHQETMSETELAKKLGVSRKCLWERRQRLGIPRKRASRNQRSA